MVKLVIGVLANLVSLVEVFKSAASKATSWDQKKPFTKFLTATRASDEFEEDMVKLSSILSTLNAAVGLDTN